MKKIRAVAAKPLITQLAIRIVEQIRSQDVPQGTHLVEQALADALHVSRSPVREALLLLERDRIVAFHPNRGFFLALPAGEIGDLSLETPVFAEEEKYRQIAEDRIQGKLHGHISEAELMSRYEISRVKLMKILVRMSQEGWVERRPGHGWTFLPVLDTVESLDQSYRFRILIEPAALLEPTYRVDPTLFVKLREEHECLFAGPMDDRMPMRMFETGARFHERIVSCCGNRFFIDAISHINRIRRLIEYKVRVDQTRQNRFHEHIEILSLLERGKRATAAAMLREHLDQARINKTVSSAEQDGS